jgi:hypothetical protein
MLKRGSSDCTSKPGADMRRAFVFVSPQRLRQVGKRGHQVGLARHRTERRLVLYLLLCVALSCHKPPMRPSSALPQLTAAPSMINTLAGRTPASAPPMIPENEPEPGAIMFHTPKTRPRSSCGTRSCNNDAPQVGIRFPPPELERRHGTRDS